MFGFGAVIDNVNVSHCFAVNGNMVEPECDGLEEVKRAYKNAITKAKLHGPTNFASVLKTVVDMTEADNVSQTNQKYFIHLLITDGIISDIEKTIDQLVRGSSLPLSVIIVGVGQADFSSMDILDGDDAPLYSSTLRRYCSRDIVQFVPFRDFK